MTRPRFAMPLVCLLGVIGGCGRSPDTSPPEIRYGERECDWCRMLVSDERFAAALVFERDGDVTKLAFDDINCVFSYLADHPVAGPYLVYTHDLKTRGWLNARDASFVRSARLETPMASQIAAAPDPVQARSLLERFPGTLLTFDDVARLFARPAPAAASQGDKAP